MPIRALTHLVEREPRLSQDRFAINLGELSFTFTNGCNLDFGSAARSSRRSRLLSHATKGEGRNVK